MIREAGQIRREHVVELMRVRVRESVTSRNFGKTMIINAILKMLPNFFFTMLALIGSQSETIRSLVNSVLKWEYYRSSRFPLFVQGMLLNRSRHYSPKMSQAGF